MEVRRKHSLSQNECLCLQEMMALTMLWYFTLLPQTKAIILNKMLRNQFKKKV